MKSGEADAHPCVEFALVGRFVSLCRHLLTKQSLPGAVTRANSLLSGFVGGGGQGATPLSVPAAPFRLQLLGQADADASPSLAWSTSVGLVGVVGIHGQPVCVPVSVQGSRVVVETFAGPVTAQAEDAVARCGSPLVLMPAE